LLVAQAEGLTEERPQMCNDLLVDCFRGKAPVQREELGEREAVKDGTATTQVLDHFEVIRRIGAGGADSFEGFLWRKIDEKDGIRTGSKGLMQPQDGLGIQTAAPLISRRREVITVKKDDFFLFQGRTQQFADMLSAITEEEFQFVLGREGASQASKLTDTLSPGAIRGFAAKDQVQLGPLEGPSQETTLARFAGTVDPLEGDET
jgi:hypothetical protein